MFSKQMLILQHHAVVIGATQTGKTTTAVALARLQADMGNRTCFFINTKGDLKFSPFFDSKRPIDLEFMGTILDEQIKGVFEIRPYTLKKSVLDQIEPFITLLLDYKRDNIEHEVCLAIDEAHLFQSKMTLATALKNIVTMGLGLNLFIITIAQRPQMINNTIFSQSDYYFLHALDQNDLKYLWDNRYITSFPAEWLLPASDPNCTYPFGGAGISHRLFVQINPTKPMFEIKLKNPFAR